MGERVRERRHGCRQLTQRMQGARERRMVPIDREMILPIPLFQSLAQGCVCSKGRDTSLGRCFILLGSLRLRCTFSCVICLSAVFLLHSFTPEVLLLVLSVWELNRFLDCPKWDMIEGGRLCCDVGFLSFSMELVWTTHTTKPKEKMVCAGKLGQAPKKRTRDLTSTLAPTTKQLPSLLPSSLPLSLFLQNRRARKRRKKGAKITGEAGLWNGIVKLHSQVLYIVVVAVVVVVVAADCYLRLLGRIHRQSVTEWTG